MKIFRLLYTNNEVVTCTDVSNYVGLNGIYHYEHRNGSLVYAIVKAANEDNAITIGNFITKELSAIISGENLVSGQGTGS